MTTIKTDELRIRLNTIEELFATPTANPFEPNSRYQSGVEELAHRLAGMHLKRTKIRLIITLPTEALEPNLKARTQAALGRYCANQIELAGRELELLRRKGRFSLISAIIIIIVAIIVVSFIGWLNILGETLQSFLVAGLSVFSWVAVWEPFNIYLYNWRPPARTRQVFERLRQAELVIEPYKGGSDE